MRAILCAVVKKFNELFFALSIKIRLNKAEELFLAIVPFFVCCFSLQR